MSYNELIEKIYIKKKFVKRTISKYKEKWKKKPDRFYYVFIPVKNKKIVFDSYLGQGYSDNQKAIAQEILKQGLKYDIVFLSREKTSFPKGIRQVEYGTRKAMRELATAKMWVFNTRMVRHPKKRKKQIYLQTWHGGYPLKLIEKQAESNLGSMYLSSAKEDGKITDAVISSCGFMSKIYENDFWLKSNAEILEFGEPKNDVLFNNEYKNYLDNLIRMKYSIPKESKVILYFPTFRNNGLLTHYNLDCHKVISAFENLYKTNVVLLVRFHPNMIKQLHGDNWSQFNIEKVIDVSSYPESSDFYCIADSMISDYSSVMLAFALQRKPVFIYANDIKEYIKERGFNELYDRIPCKKCCSIEELINEIISFTQSNYDQELEKLFHYIKSYDYGDASKKTVKWIKMKMGG